MNTDGLTIGLSTGKSRTAKAWAYKQWAWGEFVRECSTPKRTYETVAQYRDMPRERQSDIKDVGGFVAASLRGNQRRNRAVELRTAITLDLDNVGCTADEVCDRLDVGITCVVYSTHKHTPQKPRLRIVIPFAAPVKAEMYEPVARMVAKELGIIDMCDSTTFEACRLFFWPSVSKDGEYYFRHFEGTAVDAYKFIIKYGDWRDCSEWPRVPGEADLKHLARAGGVSGQPGADAQDPLTKSGIIGAFCRAHFPIGKGITELLPEVYREGKRGYYTYIAGSTVNGVWIIDDRFAYSYHNTDPAHRTLCNIFDLVRVHLFGDLDEGSRAQTIEKMKSFGEMLKYAENDPATKMQLAKELKDDFADIYGTDGTDGEGEPPPDAAQSEGGTDAWVTGLTLKGDKVEPTAPNILHILRNDPRLTGMLRYNLFADRIEKARRPPWQKGWSDGDLWTDRDDSELRVYFESLYKVAAKEKILDAVVCESARNSYHPVKDYFAGLPVWDGTPRAATLFVDYLGAQDTKLTKAVSALMLYACVVRVMRPGCKFDYCCVLTGPEGIGKSTVLAKLGGRWFTDSANPTADPKTFVENIRGFMICEWGEMTQTRYSDNESVKAVLSRTFDSCRPAYGRRRVDVPRQCVFFASTNSDSFLKGLDGNRRFLVVPCGTQQPKKDFRLLDEERDQVWAEVLHEYKARPDRPLYLPRELDLSAREMSKAYNIDEQQKADIRSLLVMFLETKLPEGWEDRSLDQRIAFYKGDRDLIDNGINVRDKASAIEFVCEVLRKKTTDSDYKYFSDLFYKIMREMPEWEPLSLSRHTEKIYGKPQRAFKKNLEVKKWP